MKKYWSPGAGHTSEINSGFKEYSLEVMAELPQTKVADSQPSPRAGRPEGLVELMRKVEKQSH